MTKVGQSPCLNLLALLLHYSPFLRGKGSMPHVLLVLVFLISLCLKMAVAVGVTLTPMIGGSGYVGEWGNHIQNSYQFGLAVDMPLGIVSVEAEGGHGRYGIAYSHFKHYFNQYNVGANLKAVIVRSGIVHPYVGAGLMGLYYANMNRGPQYSYLSYNHWLGSGQVLFGAEVEVASDIAVGIRGSYVVPLINRPHTADNGVYSLPYFEEAAAINTSTYRIMGTVSILL